MKKARQLLRWLDELGWWSPSRIAASTFGVALSMFTLAGGLATSVEMIVGACWTLLAFGALAVRAWYLFLLRPRARHDPYARNVADSSMGVSNSDSVG